MTKHFPSEKSLNYFIRFKQIGNYNYKSLKLTIPDKLIINKIPL